VTYMITAAHHHDGAWHRYITAEHQARAIYLSLVEDMHHQYLTGPWPDRAAYEIAERMAWNNYYSAGREAWRYYTAEITPPPPPAAQSADIPIPVYPTDHRTDEEARFPRRPSFTEYNGGTQ
jgi:hypothetical protein